MELWTIGSTWLFILRTINRTTRLSVLWHLSCSCGLFFLKALRKMSQLFKKSFHYSAESLVSRLMKSWSSGRSNCSLDCWMCLLRARTPKLLSFIRVWPSSWSNTSMTPKSEKSYSPTSASRSLQCEQFPSKENQPQPKNKVPSKVNPSGSIGAKAQIEFE